MHTNAHGTHGTGSTPNARRTTDRPGIETARHPRQGPQDERAPGRRSRTTIGAKCATCCALALLLAACGLPLPPTTTEPDATPSRPVPVAPLRLDRIEVLPCFGRVRRPCSSRDAPALVRLLLAAGGAPEEMRIWEGSGGESATWVPYRSEPEVLLTGGDGARTINVQLRRGTEASSIRSARYDLVPDDGKVESFHHGARAVRGPRPLMVLHGPLPGGPATPQERIRQMFFGPYFPNVAAWSEESSRGRFRWTEAGTHGPYTIEIDGRALTGAQIQSAANPTLALVRIRDPSVSHRYIHARNGGGATTYVHGRANQDSRGVFLIEHDDGNAIEDGDRLAFRTVTGHYLGRAGDDLVASSTVPFEFRIERVCSAPPCTDRIRNEDPVRLRDATTDRWLQLASGGIRFTNDIAEAATLALSKGEGSTGWYARDLVAKAAADGVDFAALDLDGDGLVTTDETPVVYVYGSNDIGANRWAGTIPVPGQDVAIVAGDRASFSTGRASLATHAHEVTHFLGAWPDLYGNGGVAGRVTLMGGTITSHFDARVYELDPWNRLLFAWEEPKIVDACGSSDGGGRVVLPIPRDSTSAALLLYLDGLYDPDARAGEYWLIEYREGIAGSYDQDVAWNGTVVWSIRTDSAGVPVETPGRGSGVNHWQVGSAALGTGPFLRPGDAWVPLRSTDGTAQDVQLRVVRELVGADAAEVEWACTRGTGA